MICDFYTPLQRQFECYEPDYQAFASERLYSESFVNSAKNQIKQMLVSGELKLTAVHGVLGPSSHYRKQSNVTIAATDRRHMCGVIVSQGVLEGDTVVLLHGSELIHVLRPTDSERTFSLICAGWFWSLGPQKSTHSSLTRGSVPFEDMTETLTAEMNLAMLGEGLSKRLDSKNPGATTFEKRVFDLYLAQGNGPWSNYAKRQNEEEFVIV